MGARSPEDPAGGWDYHRLFEAVADPLFVLDKSDANAIRVATANAACTSFFGVPAEQSINRLLPEILPASVAVRISAECARCEATPDVAEFAVDLRTAVRGVFSLKLTVIPESAGARYIVAMAHPSPIHSVPPASSVSEHSRVIAEHAADYISICSPEGKILYNNPAVARLGGPVFAAMVGKDPADWDPRPAHADIFLRCIRQVTETGAPQSFEMDFTVPATGQVVYHHVMYAPVWGADGKVVSVIGIGRDITKLKDAEADLKSLNATLEERVEARTRELERANDDLRSFASTVSHDVRAPLRTIHQYLAVLAEDEGERLSDDGRAILARVRASATKLDRLTHAILKYSQAGQDVMAGERVAMTELAREIAEELVPRESNVRITIADLPVASADSTMVRQILQNLVANAVKYSAVSKAPHIEIGSLEEDGQAVYYVRDNGAGFDMRHAHKLFSMLGRLHTEDKFPGSGVGLAIVKRLVEKHGGRAWAEGRPDEGATFYFTLGSKA